MVDLRDDGGHDHGEPNRRRTFLKLVGSGIGAIGLSAGVASAHDCRLDEVEARFRDRFETKADGWADRFADAEAFWTDQFDGQRERCGSRIDDFVGGPYTDRIEWEEKSTNGELDALAQEVDDEECLEEIEKTREKCLKEFEKAREKCTKEIEKARETSTKEIEKAREKCLKEVEKAREKCLKEIEKAREKCLKEIEKARKKAETEREKAQKAEERGETEKAAEHRRKADEACREARSKCEEELRNAGEKCQTEYRKAREKCTEAFQTAEETCDEELRELRETCTEEIDEAAGKCDEKIEKLRETLREECAPPGDGDCLVCGDGDAEKVGEITFTYTGDVPATVTAYDDKEDKDDAVAGTFEIGSDAERTFAVTPPDDEDEFGNDVSVYVDGERNAAWHTSCSKPFGPGLADGDVEVTGATDENGRELCPVGCADCGDGDAKGVSQLTISDSGGGSVTVYDGKDDDDAEIGTFDTSPFTITPPDDEEEFATDISFFVDGRTVGELHTSCSRPLHVGTIFGDGDRFTVEGGRDEIGRELCP